VDAVHFDALTRWLSDRSSRRTALGLTLGGLAGGLAAGDVGAKKHQKKCKKKCGPCRKCKRGKCKPKANGTPCGTSTHGGTTLRCCNGACPDPDCQPSGSTGEVCFGDADCAGIDCCVAQSADCLAECFCFFATAGGACGSDHDCSMIAGPETACICGTCQAPPA
jgi:hypothetical protein